MTEDKARHYAKVVADVVGITFYVVRSGEGGFIPVQIPPNGCEIIATVSPPSTVDPHR